MLPSVREPVCAYAPPLVVCGRSRLPAPEVFDGRLDKPFWAQAKEITDFHDIEGDGRPRPLKKTAVRLLWDEQALYVGAKLWDDTIWATVSQRDDVIFVDNDFEVFLSPERGSHRYYELEMNALGTAWDLLMEKPQRDGVRRILSWDIHGLRTAVHVEGELNNPQADNRFWSLEIMIPWESLRACAPFECAPERLAPVVGETWRLNFSRVEYRVDAEYRKLIDPASGKPWPEFNWVWAPTGVIDIHMPEMWGFLQFADDADAPFVPEADERARWELRKLYYRQRNFGAAHGYYTPSFGDLRGTDAWTVRPEIFVTPTMFEILADGLHIRQDGYIWRE